MDEEKIIIELDRCQLESLNGHLAHYLDENDKNICESCYEDLQAILAKLCEHM